MYRFLLIVITLFLVVACEKKEQQPTELHIIDATDFQPSTYVNKDGRYYHRDNIFAPRKDESIHDESYKKRMHIGEYRTSSSYDEGYEDGYEDAIKSLE